MSTAYVMSFMVITDKSIGMISRIELRLLDLKSELRYIITNYGSLLHL